MKLTSATFSESTPVGPLTTVGGSAPTETEPPDREAALRYFQQLGQDILHIKMGPLNLTWLKNLIENLDGERFQHWLERLQSQQLGQASPSNFAPPTPEQFREFAAQLDTDGVPGLSPQELDAALSNPDYQGDEAAIVATLYANGGYFFPDAYLRNRERLARNSTQDLGNFDPYSLMQGSLGSCTLLAAIASQAEVNPQVLRDMIRDLGEGQFEVTFPGEPPVQVSLNDSERALAASADGLWAAVLEKAFGMSESAQRGSTSHPYEIYRDGESPVEAVEAINSSDGESLSYQTRPNPILGGFQAEGEMQGERIWSSSEWFETTRVFEEQPDFLQLMSNALSEGRPVVAGIRNSEGKPFPNLASGHAYSILAIDGDTITVRNPWGEAPHPGLEPTGLGQPLDGQMDGVFQMPLGLFLLQFDEIAL